MVARQCPPWMNSTTEKKPLRAASLFLTWKKVARRTCSEKFPGKVVFRDPKNCFRLKFTVSTTFMWLPLPKINFISSVNIWTRRESYEKFIIRYTHQKLKQTKWSR
ncbi:hypothetical protein Y032_0581g273 [Ancylostoma ceylanicum]|uniref:Uncharacterized protein n=1 Tax=Ancylostoma ceylanicum TaxID=53326 RepID=A0A016WN99_9BILA|nr:hypothetical protein Y032_0581g273 [Ancylostoma ceylanicum]